MTVPKLVMSLVSYGPTSGKTETLSGHSTYQMAPSEAQQHKGIIHLILHFRWTWIGLIIVDDERGERFQQAMLPLFSENGICSAFIYTQPQINFIEGYWDLMLKGWKDYDNVMRSKANAVVLFGDTATISFMRAGVELAKVGYTTAAFTGKVYIMTIQMDFTSYHYQRDWDKQILHGAISFTGHTNEPPGFQRFLRSRKPFMTPEDGYIRDFWEQAFLCHFSDSLEKMDFNEHCTGEEKLESLPGDVFEINMTGTSYSIYNAVYAVSYALHVLHLSLCGHRRTVKRKECNLFHQPWQLHHFLKSVSFNNSAGDTISFDANGQVAAGFDIVNWIAFPSESYYNVKIGEFHPEAPADQMLTINDDAITWNSHFNQEIMGPMAADCGKSWSRLSGEGS
uniref:Uncharacterized protein n=1 Tax=Sphaerodactylus townsendi TaxID=933632 RepID=A0ACB8EWK4_9SAUR